MLQRQEVENFVQLFSPKLHMFCEYSALPETSTIEMEIEGHCSLLHFRGGFWYIKPGGNDYKYSKRPFFVQGPLILSGGGGCCEN